MTGRLVRASLVVVLTGSAILSLALMLYVIAPPELAEWPIVAMVAAWALAPYPVLAGIGVRCWRRSHALAVLLAGALVLGGGGLFVYYDGFFVHGDQLSGLLFVVIPFYQLLGCGLLAILTRSWRRRHLTMGQHTEG